MGRGSDLFRYSGMANPDITSGARLLLEGLGTPSDLVDKANVRERVELQDARQARLDALNTPGSPEWIAAKEAEQQLKLGAMSAEQEWKAANDPVYQNALAAAKRETPGTPEWTAAQNALRTMKLEGMTEEQKWKMKNDPAYQAQINALNIAEKERKGRELLANAIIGLPTETVTKTTITPEQVDKARTGLESAAVVNAGDVYTKEFAKLRTPVTTDAEFADGYEIKPKSSTVMSEEEAHQEALKRVGLLNVIAGNAPIIDESKLPKVGTTETKKKLTAEELNQAKLDATVKAAQEGKVPAVVALEVASKLTPVKTQKEKLEEAKYALDVAEFNAKKEGGMFKKSAGDNSKGDWIKSYDAMIKTYGSPDLMGKGDQADLEAQLANIQSKGYTDKEMTAAIDAARGVYGGATFGVDEDGFIEAVKKNLLKLK